MAAPGAVGGGDPAAPSQTAQKLQEYKQLLDQGLISQEDYDKAKDEILKDSMKK